jgi:hypothetical protein
MCGTRGDGLFEGVNGLAVRGAHGHEHQSFECQAQCMGVETRAIAADCSGAFEGAQSAVAGGDAEPDPRYRTVLPAVGGLTGHMAATAVVAAGVAAVLARSPLTMAALTAAGAVYLVLLGVSTLAHSAVPQPGAEPADESWVRQAAKGAGISGLNPKVFLLYLALLPQFTRSDRRLVAGRAGRVARAGPRGQLCPCLHRREHRCTVGASGASHGGPSGDPLLRCCDGPGRCAVSGRATGRVEA